MSFVAELKSIVDLVSSGIPNPNDEDTVEVVKYNVELDDDFRGKYVAVVTPDGVNSNPTSRSSSYPEFVVGVYCMYFRDTNDTFLQAREKFLGWVDKVFDAFHLKDLDGNVSYMKCDFKLSSGEFGKMTESVIRGVVSLSIRKTMFVRN